jgi:hypothetical protein
MNNVNDLLQKIAEDAFQDELQKIALPVQLLKGAREAATKARLMPGTTTFRNVVRGVARNPELAKPLMAK